MRKSTFVLVRTPCLVIFCLFISLFVVISKAEAGGYDPPPEETKKKQQPLLNWEKWDSPYSWEKNVCRERYGNLVCLPQQVAQKLGWNQISSPKSKSNLEKK